MNAFIISKKIKKGNQSSNLIETVLKVINYIFTLGEPIVVLHVALTTEISASIASVVKHHRGRVKKLHL